MDDLEMDQEMDFNETFRQFMGNTQDVITRYTHCHLCGAHLHFSYFTDFTHNFTHEMAQCPECGTKARKVLHKLQ